MKTIRIETVANGFMASVHDGAGSDFGGLASLERYAFESFESLTKWLSQQLEKPVK